jgi:heme exporter protein B
VSPGLLRAAWLLARKDLLLEARSRELSLSLALFVLATLVLFQYAVAREDATVSPRVAGGLLWVSVLLAALLALNRSFAAERDEGLLDGLLLAPVDRGAIWLSKAIVLALLLAALEVVAQPLFWLIFYATAQEPTPALAPLLATLVLADVGLAFVGSLVASLASAARQREVLLPVLFLPVAIPLLIAAVGATLASAEGDGVARYLGLIGLYDSLFAVLAWGAYEHVITE